MRTTYGKEYHDWNNSQDDLLILIEKNKTMRQITKEAVKSFFNNTNYSKSNTFVNNNKFYLHNNLIAEIKDNKLILSNCGWFSNTTKERLNGILEYIGKPLIYQKNFIWYLNGNKWNGNRIEIKL